MSDERIYPCANCGVLRSKAEGGTVFTVCDDCWPTGSPSTDSIAPPLPGDLKRCKECGVERFVARCGIDREAWNVAMWNLGEQKLRADRAEAALASIAANLDRTRALLDMVRGDFDRAIVAHDSSDPRHRSHGGQHTNGRCCAFGNLSPGAVIHMRRLADIIDAALAATKGAGE